MDRFTNDVFEQRSNPNAPRCHHCNEPERFELRRVYTYRGAYENLCPGCRKADELLSEAAQNLAELPGCLARKDIIETHVWAAYERPMAELVDALKTHDAECGCSTRRKPVASETGSQIENREERA